MRHSSASTSVHLDIRPLPDPEAIPESRPDGRLRRRMWIPKPGKSAESGGGNGHETEFPIIRKGMCRPAHSRWRRNEHGGNRQKHRQASIIRTLAVDESCSMRFRPVRKTCSSSKCCRPWIDGLDSGVAELTSVPCDDGEPACGRRCCEEGIRHMIIESLPVSALFLHNPCACLCVGQ